MRAIYGIAMIATEYCTDEREFVRPYGTTIAHIVEK